MRETGAYDRLSRPLVRVPADSELALATLLGLGSGHGAGTHPLKAGVVFGLLLVLALVLVSLGALL